MVYDGYFQNQGRICNLLIDDLDGGRQMGEHLRDLGHRDVLCVADNRECMDLRRYEGLCAGLGFPADFLKIPMRQEERTRFYQERLSQLRQYSAIFAVSDYYAVDLMRFLQGSGVRVPEEISVAGFDGSGIGELTVPSLTSVLQDGERRARMAVQLLKRMKEDPEFSGDVLLPVHLLPRDSTRPPRRQEPASSADDSKLPKY